jgi:hypothetical protein
VGVGQGCLQVLEFCGRQQPISSLIALPVTIVRALYISRDGDGTIWTRHLQDQVGIVRNYHELGECMPPEECVVCRFKISYLKLHILGSKIFSSFMLTLWMENAYPVQETFKLTWLGPVFLATVWLLYVSHGAVQLSLLVVAFRGTGPIQLVRLLILFGVSVRIFVVEGHFLGQGILVGDGKHLLGCPGVLHGELADQGRVSESLLEKQDDRFVVNLRYDVPFIVEVLDEFPEGLSLLLYDTSQVPINPWSLTSGPEVVDELLTQIGT